MLLPGVWDTLSGDAVCIYLSGSGIQQGEQFSYEYSQLKNAFA